MDFEAFRSLKGWTLEQAAAELRASGHPALSTISASVVSKHERGIHFPSPPLIERYSEITDGAVTWADWNKLRQQERPVGPRPRGRKPEQAVPA